MADELQALLNRIHEDGLKKAESERHALLEKAAADARRLLAEAKVEAGRIIAAAQHEAELLRDKGEQSLRQAARDVLLSLRGELGQRVAAVARTACGNALDPAVLAGVLTDLIRRFAELGGREQRFEVLLNPAQTAAVEQALSAALAADLRTRVDLSPVPSLKAGFRLRVSGSDVIYDFSDEALAEAMAAFLSPKLAAMVRGGSH